jgi:hypothetical protein
LSAEATRRHAIRILQSSRLPLDRFRYTAHRDNHNGNENHFQGIALNQEGSILALSGSNWRDPSADLLLFGADPLAPQAGPSHGLGRLHLDTLLWHAGGIDACGALLAVALEYPHFTGADPKRFSARVKPPRHGHTDRSRIQLVELGAVPRVVPVAINRPDFLATCVALTRMLDGRFVILALAHPKRPEPLADEPGPIPPDTVRVDCYVSHSTNPIDGFGQLWSERVPAAALPNYQSWSLLTSADDGTLLLTAFEGTARGRIVPFVIDGPETRMDHWRRLEPIELDVGPGDFRAGGALCWAGDRLRLLAAPHFRDPVNGQITVAEITETAGVSPSPVARARRMKAAPAGRTTRRRGPGQGRRRKPVT